MRTFRMLRASAHEAMAQKDTLVYEFIGNDYGCKADDEKELGIPCITVTLQPKQQSHFFVVPLADVEPIA